MRFKWLEESICETASYYFLPKLTKYWKRINVQLVDSDDNLYANLFTTYVVDNSAKAVPFNIFDQNEILNLENDCYQRGKNAYVANLLIPIFRKHCETWTAIHFLGDISEDLPLRDALKEWIQLSPRQCHNGLKQIYSLFFEE